MNKTYIITETQFRELSSLIKEGDTSMLNEFSLSDIGHTALDIAGFIPGIGIAFDAANAGWYLYEYRKTGETEKLIFAFLSAIAAIPLVGDVIGGATKIGVKSGSGILKMIVKKFPSLSKYIPKVSKELGMSAKETAKITKEIDAASPVLSTAKIGTQLKFPFEGAKVAPDILKQAKNVTPVLKSQTFAKTSNVINYGLGKAASVFGQPKTIISKLNPFRIGVTNMSKGFANLTGKSDKMVKLFNQYKNTNNFISKFGLATKMRAIRQAGYIKTKWGVSASIFLGDYIWSNVLSGNKPSPEELKEIKIAAISEADSPQEAEYINNMMNSYQADLGMPGSEQAGLQNLETLFKMF